MTNLIVAMHELERRKITRWIVQINYLFRKNEYDLIRFYYYSVRQYFHETARQKALSISLEGHIKIRSSTWLWTSQLVNSYYPDSFIHYSLRENLK